MSRWCQEGAGAGVWRGVAAQPAKKNLMQIQQEEQTRVAEVSLLPRLATSLPRSHLSSELCWPPLTDPFNLCFRLLPEPQVLPSCPHRSHPRQDAPPPLSTTPHRRSSPRRSLARSR